MLNDPLRHKLCEDVCKLAGAKIGTDILRDQGHSFLVCCNQNVGVSLPKVDSKK